MDVDDLDGVNILESNTGLSHMGQILPRSYLTGGLRDSVGAAAAIEVVPVC